MIDPQPRELMARFAPYKNIVLIANNENAKVNELADIFGDDTLFIFFNDCSRVLSEPFTRPSLLCHRLDHASDQTFVRGGKLTYACSMLSERFLGQIGVIADFGSATPRIISSPRHCSPVDATIDFDYHFPNFYTVNRLPSTGFALAIWLERYCPQSKIHLYGFSGVPGTQFNVYQGHDWTLERTVLTMLAQHQRISMIPVDLNFNDTHWMSRIQRYFPQFSEGALTLAAVDVVARQQAANDTRLSKLMKPHQIPHKVKRAVQRLRANLKR